MRTHYRHPHTLAAAALGLGVRVQRPLSAADVVNSLQAEGVAVNDVSMIPAVMGTHCPCSSRIASPMFRPGKSREGLLCRD